jgi:uncharacterized membrane protein YphA (DoxX/SURF4 family)
MEVAVETVTDNTLEQTHSSRTLDAVLVLSRICLGWYMFIAGWDKVQGELDGGLGSFFAGNGWQRRAEILPGALSLILGHAWPWLEMFSGFFLFAGLRTRVMAGVIAWIVLSIGIALLFTGELLPRHHTMVMVPFALLLCVLGPGPYSLDGLIRGRTARRGSSAPPVCF